MPGKSSIGFNGFEKLKFLVEISKISKKFEKNTNPSRQALLLYELSEREPGWRFTARCHTETIAKLARMGPAKNYTTWPVEWEYSSFSKSNDS